MSTPKINLRVSHILELLWIYTCTHRVKQNIEQKFNFICILNVYFLKLFKMAVTMVYMAHIFHGHLNVDYSISCTHSNGNS